METFSPSPSDLIDEVIIELDSFFQSNENNKVYYLCDLGCGDARWFYNC